MTASTLFILSAPSGAGKSSLLQALVDADPQLRVSVSHTTRCRRPGEQDGVHYHFVEPEVFLDMESDGSFLEHAKVFDHFYGTAEPTVQAQLAQGYDVMLEIDWQGARQVRLRFPQAVSIFVFPPSTEVLEQRLQVRGQDNAATIARRMRDAVNEMSHYLEYDYLVVNDQFGRALEDLRCLVQAGRLRCTSQAERLSKELQCMTRG